MYPLLKPLLFRSDPERVHERVMRGLAWSGRYPGALRMIAAACQVRDPRLEIRRFGLTFPNPVGLAAGFDKNAVAVPTWEALGFGAVEVGSVTARAQPGNPKPRLFRLPEDGALINRMGFNNEGAELVVARLARLRQDGVRVPLGVNLGKSKVTPLEEAPGDYLYSLGRFWPHADYFVLNVSSPNTPGLRALQEGARLTELLRAVTVFARAQPAPKPVLLKIAPDLTEAQLGEVVALALRFGISGLIATNTTVSREGLRSSLDESGGLSGKPLRERSLEVLRFLRAQVEDALPLISVGGVGDAEEVYARLAAGASLVQLYTSFVYEGPLLLRRLNRGLLARLERDGAARLEEVIGSAA